MKKIMYSTLIFMIVLLAACGKQKDLEKPIILVNGGTTAMIEDDEFIAPSVFVSDNVDKDIEVIVTGDTVDTSKAGIYTMYYDATDKSGNAALQKSFTVTVYRYDVQMDIINGGFETGNLDGWSILEALGSSAAFHSDFVISTANRKEGTYFFDGSKTDDDKTGALKSSTFILGGSGWIHFRLGGGNDKEHLYLGVYKASNDEMVAKFANTNPQKYGGNEFLVGYKFNLLTLESLELGETLYIKVVDTKLENWAIIKLDDVKTFNLVEPTSNTYELAINQIN